jgi:probable biosynthetic protein (TIGR04098 family)
MKLTLGMPHLNYHGLDQVWLSKQLGHRHWELLGEGPAYSKNNERLYASFFCCSIDFNRGQDQYKEGDELELETKLFKFNSQIYRSMHTIRGHRNVGTAVFDSIFVRKDLTTNALVKDEPNSHGNDIAQTDFVFIEEHKKLKKELRAENFNNNLVKLQFNPETYFNAVKILYFANYLNLVSQCEYLCYPEIKLPIKKITTYYFANINPDDQVYGITTKENNTYTTKLVANGRAIAVCNITR